MISRDMAQAQAAVIAWSARFRTRRGALIKSFEDMGQLFKRNTGASVPDKENNLIFRYLRKAGTDDDCAAGAGMTTGVK